MCKAARHWNRYFLYWNSMCKALEQYLSDTGTVHVYSLDCLSCKAFVCARVRYMHHALA